MTGVTVTRWWWVRHGPLDPPDTIAGQSDAALAPWPRARAAALARRLPGGARWLASPLSRTRDSATHLNPAATPDLEPGLLEQHFGDWQGRRHADLDGDAHLTRFWTDPAGIAPPGGESFADLCRRVAATVAAWNLRAGDGDIVAVAHAGTIRAALAQALALSPAAALAFEVAPLSLTRIDHILVPGDRMSGDRTATSQWRIGGVNLTPDAP